MSLRICIVSEAIKTPFDEGVKIFVYNFIKELSKNFEILGISRSNNFKGDIEGFCSKALPENKLFISTYLRRKIRAFNADIIYYIPTACATIFSFFRTKVLKFYGNNVKTIMIALQPREYSAFAKKIIPFIVPDLVLAQSLKTKEVQESLGCKAKIIQAGVNLQKFIPVSESTKESLRKKYSFPTDKFIILHVGHINRNRNMQFMEQIQSMDDVQSVVLGSTSGCEDRYLIEELKKMGIIVISHYIQNIEELYQCADCYLFPVFSDGACIEVPLSIFEAMACNLPIVTTKYGGLPNLITEQDGFVYANSEEEIISKINLVKGVSNPKTRNLVEHYSWKNVVEQILTYSLA